MSDPMSESDITALISRLRSYNEWRRGADTDQPEPRELGRDIDSAIGILERLQGECDEYPRCGVCSRLMTHLKNSLID